MHIAIAFIGAGKVATTLGIYFKKKGFEIAGFYSRNHENAKKAAELTESTHYESIGELVDHGNMIWITTPDDQIATVVGQIVTSGFSPKEKKLFLHASGAHSLSILNPLSHLGFNIAGAHPLMAFNNVDSAVQMISSAWFAIEEIPNNDFSLEQFFNQCGNKTFKIDSEKRTLYHAAACMLSNYLVTLLDASYNIFIQSGMPEEIIESATNPLLESVLENLKGKSCADALTGPIKRGDIKTVELHVENLQAEMPEMVELYKVLGKQTMRLIDDYRLKNILD